MNGPVIYNPLGITWGQSLMILGACLVVGLIATYIQHRRGK
jgi:hypothetical protein